jgi:hypothetical protein
MPFTCGCRNKMRPIPSPRTLLPSSLFLIIAECTKSKKGGFFNVGNMRPEALPSARTQADSFNCGVYTCLAWTMFVAVKRNQPALWMEINTLGDLDQIIVKPFWDLHENKEDCMIHFHYKLCRLMEFLLDKRIKEGQRSRVALGSHPLPDNWVYPKVSGNSRLPPCPGGPIPAAYEWRVTMPLQRSK